MSHSGAVDITHGELAQLRPWLVGQVQQLQGFADKDQLLANALVDCLSKQFPQRKLIDQLIDFGLEENKVKGLLKEIETQTKQLRDMKKLLRQEKRKRSDNDNNHQEEEENGNNSHEDYTQRKKPRSLPGLPVPTTAASSVAAAKLRGLGDAKQRIAQALEAAKAKLQEKKEKEAAAAAMAAAAAVGGGSGATGGGGGGKERFVPPPMFVDSQGNEVDLSGNKISTKVVPQASTLFNKRGIQLKQREEDELDLQDPTKSAHYDPRLSTLDKVARPRRSFNFVEEGTYIKKAQKMRTKAQLAILNAAAGAAAEGKKAKEEAELDSTQNPNLIALGPKKIEKVFEEIPEMEWWDRVLTGGDSYETWETVLEPGQDRITHFVEHPVLIMPHEPTPAPQPLLMTTKEKKKLRRAARQEAQKEKQERVLLRLEEPPEPKVKISNMMRVLGTEVVQDPTMVEREIRKQMAQRKQNHEDRNQKRKLTKEQRKEKLRRKLQEDTSIETHITVYRVNDLQNTRNRYKIEINAKENNLSGCLLLLSGLNLVIVEGGPKAQRRFKKLMLRRIVWTETPPPRKHNEQQLEDGTGGVGDNGGKMEEDEERVRGNLCYLVWSGMSSKPNFKNFRFKDVTNEIEARRYLREHASEHFFDLARTISEDGDAVTSASTNIVI